MFRFGTNAFDSTPGRSSGIIAANRGWKCSFRKQSIFPDGRRIRSDPAAYFMPAVSAVMENRRTVSMANDDTKTQTEASGLLSLLGPGGLVSNIAIGPSVARVRSTESS